MTTYIDSASDHSQVNVDTGNAHASEEEVETDAEEAVGDVQDESEDDANEPLTAIDLEFEHGEEASYQAHEVLVEKEDKEECTKGK